MGQPLLWNDPLFRPHRLSRDANPCSFDKRGSPGQQARARAGERIGRRKTLTIVYCPSPMVRAAGASAHSRRREAGANVEAGSVGIAASQAPAWGPGEPGDMSGSSTRLRNWLHVASARSVHLPAVASPRGLRGVPGLGVCLAGETSNILQRRAVAPSCLLQVTRVLLLSLQAAPVLLLF